LWGGSNGIKFAGSNGIKFLYQKIEVD
jgi:hypothetical protein